MEPHSGGIQEIMMRGLQPKKERRMTLQQIKDFLDGKKTGSGLSIAVFTPIITSALVSAGVASDDAANAVNVSSAVLGGVITIWGIIDRHFRQRDKNPQREAAK